MLQQLPDLLACVGDMALGNICQHKAWHVERVAAGYNERIEHSLANLTVRTSQIVPGRFVVSWRMTSMRLLGLLFCNARNPHHHLDSCWQPFVPPETLGQARQL